MESKTGLYRRCSKCRREKPLAEFYRYSQCKSCHAAYNRQWRKTSEGIAYQKAYRKTPEGKATDKKYSQSLKGKITRRNAQKKYRQSPKGKVSGFWRHKRYRLRHPERIEEQKERFYARHGGRANYDREYYHRIQDEMGWHGDPRNSYPLYRTFVKPLLEGRYNIVEVKIE